MMLKTTALVAAIAATANASATEEIRNVSSPTVTSFLVMGDWGGQDSPPFTTAAETATAAGMGKIAASASATFGLALGDNFYSYGVKNVQDPRFQGTFEKVFTADSLQSPSFQFNVIAGNHDHRGNVTAQVAYSGVSERWEFPSLYYTFTEGDVQFVMIDTVVLAGNSDLEDGTELTGSNLPGPGEYAEEAISQMAWINKTLAASTAKYLIVAGHYPVYSICEHGPTSQLQEQLKPLLEKYRVNAYMNGHDHCAQMIQTSGDAVQYHTIGSAHLNNPSTNHLSTLPSSSDLKFHTGTGQGGFASVHVNNDGDMHGGMTVVHRDGDGTVLYTAPTMSPRY